MILGAVGKRSTTSAGSTSGSAVSSVKRPLLDELQHGCGDERLHDAAGPEAIARVHGDVRVEPTEPGRTCPAAAAGALGVQDRSRDLPARARDHVVEHLLEPVCERGIELRTSNRPGRRCEVGGARRPAERGGNERAGGADDQRPSVERRGSRGRRDRDSASTWRFMRVIGVPPFGLVGSDIEKGSHRVAVGSGPAGICGCV